MAGSLRLSLLGISRSVKFRSDGFYCLYYTKYVCDYQTFAGRDCVEFAFANLDLKEGILCEDLDIAA